jgi:hypothetical protein
MTTGRSQRQVRAIGAATSLERRYDDANAPEIDPLPTAVNKLETVIEIPAGFLLSLIDARISDWAFVVQTSAFMEGAVTHLIVEGLHRPALLETIAHIDMANTQAGRIKIARDLDLLDEVEARFLRALAELRNDLVHDVRNVAFSLSAYVGELKTDQLKAFTKKFNAFDSQSTTIDFPNGGRVVPMTDYFKDHPRIAIWNSAMSVAGIIHSRVELEWARRARDAAAIEAAKAIREEMMKLAASARLEITATGTLN